MQQKRPGHESRHRGAVFANVLSLLGAFVATSVLLGVLGAGLMLPAVGVAGATAQSGVGFFDSLPSTFKTSPLTQQTRIVAADGTVIATPFGENRRVVPLSKISKHMQHAQIAIEDERFYEHGGVDLQGIARAAVYNLAGTSTAGGSTLTQQYVKLSLLEEALREGDLEKASEATTQSGVAGYLRKLREVKYAVSLEKNSSKDRVLEGYLNLAYYGDRAYGVESAARHYFGIPAAELNPAQAATLAGIVQTPGSTDPIKNPTAALKRRNLVLFKMHELGFITDAEYASSKASKLDLKPTYERSSCSTSKYPFFCSYVTAWLLQQPALGEDPDARRARLDRGGLTIHTTMNPEVAARADKVLQAKVPAVNDENVAAAAATVEPGTGRVLAIAQNRPFGLNSAERETTVNYAVPQPYTANGGFPIGSTAKIYAMTNAMEHGLPVNGTIPLRETTPLKTVSAKGETTLNKAVFYPTEFEPCARNGKNYWAVQNDHEIDTTEPDFKLATQNSLNTGYAQLVTALGPCEVEKTMTKVGLHTPLLNDKGGYKPFSTVPASVTLGADSAVPLTVAASFATYGAEGVYCEPYPVEKIESFGGDKIEIRPRQCRRALTKEVAAAVTDIYSVVPEKAATLAKLDGGRVSAGKTGTADESKQTWFAGFTPQVATAVWAGDPDAPHALRDVKLAGKTYEGWLYGSALAAPIYKEIMEEAHEGLPKESFPTVGKERVEGVKKPMPDVTGMTVFEARKELLKVGLLSRSEFPWTGGSAVVRSTQPSAGTEVDPTTWVTLTTDRGTEPTPAQIEEILKKQQGQG